MKKFIAIAFVVAVVSLQADAQPVSKGEKTWLGAVSFTANDFSKPSLQYAPLTRWWWPGNDVEKEELKRELQLFADNHFGGVEIQPMALIMPTKGKGRAERIMSYDSPLYYSNLTSVMEEAKRLGLIVDLTDGSGWPSGGAHMTEEDNNLTLECGITNVIPGDKKTIRLPRAEKGDRPAAKIVAVIAAKTTGDQGPTLWLDDKSIVDLTKTVKDSCVIFNTNEPNWKIITFWKMADMESPMLMASRNSGFAMNHFDSLKIFKNYNHWLGERTGLDKYMGEPLRCLFNDSYEFRADRHFADDFIEKFKKNRGYNPVPYLPANIWYGYNDMYYRMAHPDTKPSFALSEEDWRLRYDYDLTVSDLLKEHMLLASKHYLEPKGMLHRTQAYGLNMDMMAMAGAASIPEMETMQFSRNSEAGYKIISSGAHLYNRPIVTCESAVYISRAFLTTPQKLKMTIDKILTSGVNQIIWHGTPYSYFPGGYPKEGWYPFYNSALGVNFSSMLSEQNPFWKYMSDINSYAQRAQYVLRSGRPQADVLIYYPFLKFSEGTQNPKELLCRGYLPDVEPAVSEAEKPFNSETETAWMNSIYPLINKLNASGVTWDWVNDESLQAMTTDGETLHVRGNEYQGLILFNAPFIQLESARRLNTLAKQGASIVVMGDAPQQQPSYKDYATNDKQTATLITDMMGNPRVKSVDSPAQLSPWIRNLHIPLRTLYHAETMRQTRRVMDDGSVAQFYWNESEQWQEVNVQIDDKYAHAYWMNPEDGSITPASIGRNHTVSNAFGPLSTSFLYCSATPLTGDNVRKEPSVVYHYPFTQATEVARINAADITLDSLQLVNNPIDDWRNDEYLEFCGDEVTYSFTIDIKKEKHHEYYIDLGKVCYSAEMAIEGQEVGKRIYAPFLFDATKQLKNGRNEVTVRVTPSKYNEFVKRGKDGQRLFKMLKESSLAAQGILGPVRVLQVSQK